MQSFLTCSCGDSFLLHEKKRITENNLNRIRIKALLILDSKLSIRFNEHKKQ
jgi:transposase-like protein